MMPDRPGLVPAQTIPPTEAERTYDVGYRKGVSDGTVNTLKIWKARVEDAVSTARTLQTKIDEVRTMCAAIVKIARDGIDEGSEEPEDTAELTALALTLMKIIDKK
jgi:hypothetical protein